MRYYESVKNQGLHAALVSLFQLLINFIFYFIESGVKRTKLKNKSLKNSIKRYDTLKIRYKVPTLCQCIYNKIHLYRFTLLL